MAEVTIASTHRTSPILPRRLACPSFRLSVYSPGDRASRLSYLVCPPRGAIMLPARISARAARSRAPARRRARQLDASSRPLPGDRITRRATNFELCYYASESDSANGRLSSLVYWRRGCSNSTPVFTNSHCTRSYSEPSIPGVVT